ncbi:MAG: extracellular solute-binding protein [Proteobacteria bacterium]|nr:extracellular solute-binding protein [Pseudomonadota bacterium]
MSSANKSRNGNKSGISRRRALQLSGAAIAAPAILSGWPAFAQQATLRFKTEDTADVEIAWYEKMKGIFEKAHPNVSVKPDYVNSKSFMQNITTSLAANDLPDFTPGTNNDRVATLVDAGVVDNVEDVVDAIGRDKFLPGSIDQFTFDGKIMGIPQQVSPHVLWYRTDLAAEENLKAPVTWDDLLEFAKKTTRPGVYGYVMALGTNTATSRNVFAFIRQGGGNLVDEDLKPVIDSAANKRTFEFMKELYQYCPPGAANFKYGDLISHITKGTAACGEYTGRVLGRVAKNNPQLAPHLRAIQEPHSASAKPFHYGGARACIIYKNAPNRDLAKQWMTEINFKTDYFMEWLLSAPGNTLPLVADGYTNPVWVNNPVIKANAESIALMQSQAGTSLGFLQESPAHKRNAKGSVFGSSPILPTMIQRYIINNEPVNDVLAWGQAQAKDVMSG